MQHPPDPASIANRPLLIDERCETLVIGASQAGLAAAIEAAQQGQAVILVDENPVPAATMGDDIPHLWGGAFNAGVETRLGTDGRPAIDRPSGLDNLVLASLSSIGFGLSPTPGHAVRDLMVDSARQVANLSSFALSRFVHLEPDWKERQGWKPSGATVLNTPIAETSD